MVGIFKRDLNLYKTYLTIKIFLSCAISQCSCHFKFFFKYSYLKFKTLILFSSEMSTLLILFSVCFSFIFYVLEVMMFLRESVPSWMLVKMPVLLFNILLSLSDWPKIDNYTLLLSLWNDCSSGNYRINFGALYLCFNLIFSLIRYL